MESSSPLLESWLAMRLLWSIEAGGIKECQLQTQASKGFHLLSKGPVSHHEALPKPQTSLLCDKPDTAQTPSLPHLTASSTRFANEATINQLAPANIPADHRHMSKFKCDLLSLDQISRTTQQIFRVMSNNKHLLFQATGFGLRFVTQQ